MIRRELKSQVNDLEKRIAKAVQAKRDKANAPLRHACTHAMAVAAVALHGQPKIDEPLRIAQSRMVENLEKEFVAVMEELLTREFGRKLDCCFRPYFHSLYPRLMFDSLPKDSRSFELKRIISEAPAWLLKFTGVEWDAKLLGFKLRKLVGTPELGRDARLDRNRWPSLPMGTIDAGGPCSEPDEPWKQIVERRCDELPVPTE